MEIEDLLIHYSSPYYDPVKAREYYLRTRELKGRTGAVAETSAQRRSEAKGYVRSQINAKKQAEESSLADSSNRSLQVLQQRAVATRDRILQKFQEQIDKITTGAKAKVPELKLNEIPENVSEKRKEFLQKANQRLTDSHNREVAKIEKQRVADTKAATDKVKEEVNKVATDLKSAVQKVRENYTSNQQALAAKYQATLANEMDNLNRNFS